MIRYLIVEIVLPILVFLFVRSILKTLFSSSRGVRTRGQAPPRDAGIVSGGELKKDPVCGTYVSTALSVTRTVNGEVVHFCSKECRDKYHVA